MWAALDSDLSSEYSYPGFEQLGPGVGYINAYPRHKALTSALIQA